MNQKRIKKINKLSDKFLKLSPAYKNKRREKKIRKLNNFNISKIIRKKISESIKYSKNINSKLLK